MAPSSQALGPPEKPGRFTCDGTMVIASRGDVPLLYPLAGGEPTQVQFLKKDDYPIRWNRDGHLCVAEIGKVPCPVAVVEPQTGSRREIFNLAPWDRSGVSMVNVVRVSADFRSYVYSWGQQLSTLYLVQGLV